MRFYMNTIAERIIQLRTAHRLTQAQLAKQLHISDKLVSKWETGEGTPSLEDILKLSDFFKVSVDYLVKGIIRDDDNKSINRLPTEEEMLEDFEKVLQKFLKKYKLSSFEKQLSSMLSEHDKEAFLKGKTEHYRKDGNIVDGFWEIEKILMLNHFYLYKILVEQRYIIDRHNGSKNMFINGINNHRAFLLTKYNVTDVEFYEKLKFKQEELNELLRAFVDGRRTWNDEIILTIIKRGGYVTDASHDYETNNTYYSKNVLATKQMEALCKKNIKERK